MTKDEIDAIRARWLRLGAHGIGEAQNDIDALIAALEQVTAERDVLARTCMNYHKAMPMDDRAANDITYWLEWAQREVARRKENT